MSEIDEELKPYGYRSRYRYGGNLYAVRLDSQSHDIAQEILLGNAERLENMTKEQRQRIYDRKLGKEQSNEVSDL